MTPTLIGTFVGTLLSFAAVASSNGNETTIAFFPVIGGIMGYYTDSVGSNNRTDFTFRPDIRRHNRYGTTEWVTQLEISKNIF